MELRQYFQIAGKWWRLVLVSTLIAAGVGFGISTVLPVRYRASISLLVNTRGSANDDYFRLMANLQLAETYKELLTKRPVIETAARSLNLDPREVEKQIRVQLVPKTSLIELTAEAGDPHLALNLANRVVEAFKELLRESGGSQASQNMSVVEPATLPLKPSSPPKSLLILVAAIVGFTLATGTIFLVEHLNDALESVEDIHHNLALPVLTIVPRSRRWSKRGETLLTIENPGSALTEAYRVLRTTLQFSHLKSSPHTLLVTTPLSRRENVDVTANLGVIMAQAGFKVLLVEADLRLPRLHQIFGLDREPGLSTLLADTGDHLAYIAKTHIPNLHLLSGGPMPPDPLQLLSSSRMAWLLEKLKKQADIILLSTPPILTAAETLVLAPQVDGVILVIESRSTRRQQAAQVLTMLHNVEADVLGVILTGTQLKTYYSDFSQPKNHLQNFLYQNNGGSGQIGKAILPASKSVSEPLDLTRATR